MLFAGPHIIVLRRDHTPGIPWPGMLDFPGGGREGAETPVGCVLREIEEELGLRLCHRDVRPVHIRRNADRIGWYFAAHCPADLAIAVRFGGEGSAWLRLSPRAFVDSPQAVPHFRAILAGYVAAQAARGP